MQNKKTNKERDNRSSFFSLDLDSNNPILEMVGNRRVTIEGSTGLLKYESENIKVNTGKMVISFSGRNLSVRCISTIDVVVEGFITGVEFIT